MPIYALVLTTPPTAPSLSDFAVERAFNHIPEAQRRSTRWLSPREAWEAEFATNEVGGAARVRAEVAQALHGLTLDINTVVADPATRRNKLLVADMESTIIQQECLDELADFAGAPPAGQPGALVSGAPPAGQPGALVSGAPPAGQPGAQIVGLRPRISEITARAMRGELEFEAAIKERVALLAGLDAKVLDEVYDKRVTLMPGAKVLLDTMRRYGARCALVSGGFTFFTERIAKRLGFDEHQANRIEIVDGRLTGRVLEPILGRPAKLAALERLKKQMGLARPLTMAVGDGANDLDMIKAAGLGVAFRAKPVVAAEADASIVHGDLTALLYMQGYTREEFVV